MPDNGQEKVMKNVVIYTSQTGFTKRYAEWIGEATEAEVVNITQAKKLNLRDCDTIILGSHVCADNIVKAKKFAKILRKYAGKKCALFVTGVSPAASDRLKESFAKAFSQYPHLHFYYFPAGFNYEKLNGISRFLINLFRKALAAQKDKTEADLAMEKMISSSYDISDKTLIVPLTEYIEGEE